MRIKVARSAEAQPEETDPAKAASVNLKLLGQNDPPSRHLASPHFVCSCRCELCHPGEHLDVLRGSHTDSLMMDEADIEDLQDRRWDASSLMVMKIVFILLKPRALSRPEWVTGSLSMAQLTSTMDTFGANHGEI